MNILVCTDGEAYAEQTIRVGGRFARGLDANITVLHVKPLSPSLERSYLTSSRKKLSEWIKELPFVQYLDRAGKTLQEMGLTISDPKRLKNARYSFRETSEDALELHVSGHGTDRVRLRLREGDTAEEILEEAQGTRYDLIITGARGHEGTAPYFVGSTALRIAEFAPCSVLIAKNWMDQLNVLICTDGSKQAEQAELFGATVSQFLSKEVTILSVASEESERAEAQDRVRRAEMVLKQLGIKVRIKVSTGRPSEEIISEAGNHHMVVIGASGSSLVRRFFLGSVPLKVIEYGECPVLLVREKHE